MTKKGLLVFRKNGVEIAAYSHRDSHLRGLGRKVVRLCRYFSVDELNKLFDGIILVNDNDEMSSEQIIAYKKYLPEENWNENLDWCSVLKYCRDITAPLKYGLLYMVNYISFRGSLRCRWIYTIDLDKNLLEICKFGLEVIGQESDIIDRSQIYPSEQEPVIVGSFPLNAIPENWIELCEP